MRLPGNQMRISNLQRLHLEIHLQTFAEITIKDSNQFHAVCQVFVLNDNKVYKDWLLPGAGVNVFNIDIHSTYKNMNWFAQDTYPPCVYMSSTSHLVCQLIHQVGKGKIQK